ncbi:MAG: deoxyribose-phosphate aldolase [Oscillospiraceae bacterium]|nr:deoxyribose-phosphate aldolase [Oscillospiraceae bacterium]MDD4414390.1 deoxyribose-phosphate aldolase [Oscillospiraceae bacterium]
MTKVDYTPLQLAKYFDQTFLKPYISYDELKAFCDEGERYGFKALVVNSAPVSKCREFIKNSDLLIGATIGFPLGQTTIDSKVYEAKKAIQDGADEIDYVINIVELKSRNFNYIHREMQELVDVCRTHDRTVKVIFENCYLTEDEKKILCEIALKVRPHFIKTSTGFGTPAPGIPVGATVEDVRLMKSMTGGMVKIKASGGIRTLEDAFAMIDAGAERIGTSAGATIIERLKELQ